ncbi:unnamed protein product, partial [Prorocentrum cordatum]
AQWLQIMWRDAVFGDVSRPDWSASQGPFSVVLSRDCEIGDSASSMSVVDAKSAFDTLSKNSAGSRAGRRNAIEMAVIRDSLSYVGSQLRRLPRGLMPADPMTK